MYKKVFYYFSFYLIVSCMTVPLHGVGGSMFTMSNATTALGVTGALATVGGLGYSGHVQYRARLQDTDYGKASIAFYTDNILDDKDKKENFLLHKCSQFPFAEIAIGAAVASIGMRMYSLNTPWLSFFALANMGICGQCFSNIYKTYKLQNSKPLTGQSDFFQEYRESRFFIAIGTALLAGAALLHRYKK